MSWLHLDWPFLAVTDGEGRSAGWCVLNGPLRKLRDTSAYGELRRSFRFIGLTSYTTFPSVAEGVVPDYEALCEGWCHCFREPELYLSSQTPKELISESDFVDYKSVSPENLCQHVDGLGKEFDFVYVCLPGQWKEMTKNWALAKRCLYPLCYSLNLKALLLGRWQVLDLPFHRNLTIVGDVPQEKLLEYLCRSRLLFVPSVMDASPRILAEALCLNVPILVNSKILGGWKYVNSHTGAFFQGEDDVAEGAQRCLHAALQPRRWFRENYGPVLSSKRLNQFLQRLDPGIQPGSVGGLARDVVV